MLMLMSENISAKTLGLEVEKALDGKSQSWLARKSGVGQSTISRIIRGQIRTTPDTETIKSIAKALGQDPLRFMRLAGIPLPTPSEELDPSALHIARRISDLPKSPRVNAVKAIEGVLDAISISYNEPSQPSSNYQAERPYDKPLNGTGSGIEILEPIYEDDPVDVRARKFTKIVREFQFLFPDEYSKIRQVLGDWPVAELV